MQVLCDLRYIFLIFNCQTPVKFSGMIEETADKTDSDHTEWGIYENDKS